MTIKGGSALRDEDLVIADRTSTGNNSFAIGSGVMQITEFGSLYNNNPNILPAEAQAAIDAGFNFHSVNPRPTGVGFDLKVGFTAGTLDISAGGRAEIQDSVLVGDAVGQPVT